LSDARTGQRFPLQLPTRIQCKGSAEEHLGVTTDVSTAGVYILAGIDFEVGSGVTFELVLPEEVAGARVRLRCDGRVVRSDDAAKAKELGIACVIDTFEFVRDSEGQESHDAEADHS
jgi:PilZ domain